MRSMTSVASRGSAVRQAARPSMRPTPSTSRVVQVRSWEVEQETRPKPRQHPDPDFIAEVLAAFPDEGVANVEQALVSGFGAWSMNVFHASWT